MSQPTQINWKDYRRIGQEQNYDIFQHKEKGAKPEYAFRLSQAPFTDVWGIANNLTDVTILVEELFASQFGLGIATGYRRGGGPTMTPEKIYRSVGIGKYLFRSKAIDLPGFMANVRPHRMSDVELESLPATFYEVAQHVEGDTVKDVQAKIDETIKVYPKKYRVHFPAT